MENIIEGKIINVLPEESGVSKSGTNWRKQVAVLETAETYPRKIAFQMFNDKIVQLAQGQSVKVYINIESREWNGRWYTDINAWKVELSSITTGQQQAQQVQSQQQKDDDLPF